MKDSSSKSRLSDEGVRKKEPSVAKVEGKELSEPTVKATLPKVKNNTLETVKIKSVKLKNAKSIKASKKSEGSSMSKSPVLRKKTVDNTLVKRSPKSEAIKKESNIEIEKSILLANNAGTIIDDIEIDIATFQIRKDPERSDAKKEYTKAKTKAKVKKIPSETFTCELGSSNLTEKKNNVQKGELSSDRKKTQVKQTAEHNEKEKGLTDNVDEIAALKAKRGRLTLREQKLLYDARKAEQAALLTSDKPVVVQEDPKVQVLSAVTIFPGKDVEPLKKSRDRKKSFKARELCKQSSAKTASHANQVKDIAPATKLAKLHAASEPIPIKTKTDSPKVNSTGSLAKKEPTDTSPMLKFTYEKPTDSSLQEQPTDSKPLLTDGLKSLAKQTPITPPQESSGIEPGGSVVEISIETDIESQLQALEDKLAPGDKAVQAAKETTALPAKTDAPEGFQPGARMEALEISTNKWYSVKVVEVDWAENEVLIHFEKWSQRFDEWIQMDSSRLRPCEPREALNEKLYHVGETVMATWMNSQKYPAKVKKLLGNDFLEVLFFDGFTKTMRTNKVTKCVGNEGLEPILPPPPPALMSKLERRERKRKIQSVAELFHMKKKKYKTKKSNDLSIDAKPNSASNVVDTLSKKRHKYTDLTNISDNEGEKTYIDLNASFTQEERETEPKQKEGNKVVVPTVPTKRPYKRKKLLNAVTDATSTESGSAKDGIFPFKGRKHNDAIGSDYDNWEPEGEEAYVVETADGLRRSLVVKDDRLPTGWAKHTIQRRSGNSAGKWDVFLVSPGGRRFRSRKEMQAYFSDIGEEYRPELFDFTLRCNMRRKCNDTVYVRPSTGRRTKHLTLRKHKPTLKLASSMILDGVELEADGSTAGGIETPQRKYKIAKLPKGEAAPTQPEAEPVLPATPVPEGTVLIGNLQVHLDPAGAYVCPSDSCSKHFRRENLLQMHIKHYHPDLSAFVGTTPNVADLAYARTMGAPVEDMALSGEYFERLHRVEVAKKLRLSSATLSPPSAEKKPADKKANKSIEPMPEASPADRPAPAADSFARPATSTPLRDLLRKDTLLPPPGALAGVVREHPKAGVTAGIKTLLPIVRSMGKLSTKDAASASDSSSPWTNYPPSPSDVSVPSLDGSFHKLKARKRRLSDAYMDGLKKRKHGSSKSRTDDGSDLPFSPMSDDGSFMPPTPLRIPPGSMKKKNPLLSASLSRPLPDYIRAGGPDLLALRPRGSLSTSSLTEPMTEEQLNKRDIINCTCGVMEEDGLMIQCDLCLCWQHGYCNNIERENEVPEKYVCYICQHPARERMSAHYLHDQDWLNEGVLPSLSERSSSDPVVTNRTALLRKSHDLAAGLLQLQTTIKSLRVKVNVANTPDHPKLYLWAKPWEKSTEPKLDHSCIEPSLLNHDDGSTMPLSTKDGNNLSSLKPEGSNGQFISDIGGESRSLADASGPNEIVHGDLSEKELPKMPEVESSLAEVKEKAEDAGNLGRECKTELESVNAFDEAETKSTNVSDDVKLDETVKADEKPAVPKNAEESTDVDESKCDRSFEPMVMVNSMATEDAKQADLDEAKVSLDDLKQETHSSAPLMEGVASTSSQVPLIESSLQSKQFSTEKTAGDMDTTLLMQALSHGGHEPALTNGNDLSNGHLDPSLLNFPISKMELLRFANSIADNFKAAAVVNHSHPHAPEPEKPIDPRECRLLLLDHIELKQREVKQQLELLEDQLSVLEAEDPEPPGEETLDFFPQTKQTVKMLLRDLNTLKKISEIN